MCGLHLCYEEGRTTLCIKAVIFFCLADKINTGPSWLIWVFLILCVVVLLTIMMIVLRNRRKKNGQYSFVSNNGTDNIPMSDKPEA